MASRSDQAFEVPLWRALAVYRIAALAYATLLVTLNFRTYAHPLLSWVVIAVMAAWTTLTIYGYGQARWRRWPLLVVDVAITAAAVLVSPWILGDTGLAIQATGMFAMPRASPVAPRIGGEASTQSAVTMTSATSSGQRRQRARRYP